MEFSAEETAFLVRTACWTIRRRLEGAPSPVAVPPFSPAVMRPAGCFVSLHERAGHGLRGCIGRIDSASPLLEALINSAWGAARDPRFAGQPLAMTDLERMDIELSVLGQLKPVVNPADYEPQRDGIYLTIGNRSGVFLPQVAWQTGWTREQLLDRLCQEKLGVPPATWRQPGAFLFTFSALVVGPTAFLADESPFPAAAPK